MNDKHKREGEELLTIRHKQFLRIKTKWFEVLVFEDYETHTLG